MESVFLIIGKWDYTVLLGNLLSAVCGILNFYLLGLTVQKAVDSDDEAYAKKFMRMSQALRLLLTFGILLLAALIPCFNIFSAIIPLLFPRIAFALRPLFAKKLDDTKEVSEIEKS